MRLAPVVWLTGLSGSGKSTIAREVVRELGGRGLAVELLDGDVVRTELSKDLGFSRDDRCANLLRISFVAGLLSRHGVIVLVAAISPYRQIRDQLRHRHDCLIEAFVNAPLEICEQRDPKGLYRLARAGLLEGFTGISDPYEPPVTPDVECRTDQETVELSCKKVVQAIEGVLRGGRSEAPAQANA